MFHATPNEISDFPLQTSVEKNNGSTKAIKSAINAALGSLPAAEALTTAGEEWLLNIEADLKGVILLKKRAAQKAALRISMKLKNYFLALAALAASAEALRAADLAANF